MYELPGNPPNIISDVNKIKKAKAQKKIVSRRNKSNIAKFPTDRLPAIINAMTSIFARYYAKLKVPIHTDPDRSLRKEEYYRLLRACPAWNRATRRAITKLSGLTYHFDKTQYSHPDWIAVQEQVFEGIKNFMQARAWLANTLFEGRSWLKIIWGYRAILIPSLNKRVKLKVPVELQQQPKELYQYQTTQVSENEILGEWTEGNLATGGRDALTDWDSFDYITVAYMPELRNMFYGEALNSYAIALIESLQVLVNYALVFAEKKAEVHVLIKSKFTNLLSSELQAYLKSGDAKGIERLKSMIQYFAESKQGGTLLLGPDDDASVLDASGRGDQIYVNLLNWIDQQLETWVLSVLGQLDQPGGSQAKAETGRQEQNDYLAWYQQYLIEEPMNELCDKILFACDYALDMEGNPALDDKGEQILIYDNYLKLQELGLTNYKVCKFKLGEVGKEEPKDMLPIIQTVMSTPGAGMKTDEFYERLGITRPEGLEEVLKTPEQPQMGMGGLGGMFGGGEPAGTPTDQGEASFSEKTSIKNLIKQAVKEVLVEDKNAKEFKGAIREALFDEVAEFTEMPPSGE